MSLPTDTTGSLSTAETLLLSLESDMTLASPEAVDERIHARSDCRNDLQTEIDGIDIRIDALSSAKRKLRDAKARLQTQKDKLTAYRWQLWADRKASGADR